MKKIMFTLIFYVIFFCMITVPAFAAALLSWDATVVPEGCSEVIGYVIHYSQVGHENGYVKNVNNVLTYPLETDLNLAYGVEYTFYVTAYNSNGESPPSNSVEWVRPNNVIPADNVPDMIINVPPGSTLNVTIVNRPDDE